MAKQLVAEVTRPTLFVFFKQQTAFYGLLTQVQDVFVVQTDSEGCSEAQCLGLKTRYPVLSEKVELDILVEKSYHIYPFWEDKLRRVSKAEGYKKK